MNANPRAERNDLVRFVATLPTDAVMRLHLALDDVTYQGCLDYLDPDLPHLFIHTRAVRQALLIGCKTHIAAIYC